MLNKKNEYQLIAYEVLKAMDTSLEHENVALSATQAIKAHTNWQTVAILVPDSHETLYVCASIGSLPIVRDLIKQTQRTGEDQKISSLMLTNYGYQRYGALTARIGNVTNDMGILYVSNLESSPLQEDDTLLAAAIADALTIGLNNVKLMRQLQQQAQPAI